MKKKISKEEVNTLVFSSLREKDWGAKDSIEYKTTAILLASALIGGFGEKIAHLLGYTKAIGRNVEKEARKNGIWDKSGKVHVEWFEKKTGTIALACDTAVCMGWLKRSESPAKEVGKKRWEGSSFKEKQMHSKMMNEAKYARKGHK